MLHESENQTEWMATGMFSAAWNTSGRTQEGDQRCNYNHFSISYLALTVEPRPGLRHCGPGLVCSPLSSILVQADLFCHGKWRARACVFSTSQYQYQYKQIYSLESNAPIYLPRRTQYILSYSLSIRVVPSTIFFCVLLISISYFFVVAVLRLRLGG